MTSEMALVLGALLTAFALVYGIHEIRWANTIIRRCKRIQKQIRRAHERDRC